MTPDDGSVAALVLNVNISAGINKEINNLDVSELRRPGERRRAEDGPMIDDRAGVDEPLDNLCVASLSGDHERRFSDVVLKFKVGSEVDQELDKVLVAVVGGNGEGGCSVGILVSLQNCFFSFVPEQVSGCPR